VRRPDYTEAEMRGVAVGNQTVVKLTYAHTPQDSPQDDGEPAPAAPVTTPASPAPAPPAAPVTMPAVPAPGPGAPGVPMTMTRPGGTPGNLPPALARGLARPAPSAPQSTASVNFAPAQVEAKVGGSFKVNLVVANASDLFSAPLQITYDPKALKLDDVTQGNLIGSDGKKAVFSKNIQNDTGQADIILNRLPGDGGITGSGMLVTLSFTALAPGSSTVSAPAFSPSNSLGQPIANASPQLTVNVK